MSDTAVNHLCNTLLVFPFAVGGAFALSVLFLAVMGVLGDK